MDTREKILNTVIVSLVVILLIVGIANLIKDNTKVRVYSDHYTGCKYLISGSGDINNMFDQYGELYCGKFDPEIELKNKTNE